MSAEIIEFAEHRLRRARMAYEVTMLPQSAENAVLRLLQLYVDRRASPSPEIVAAIARAEDTLRRGHVHELDPPASLVAH